MIDLRLPEADSRVALFIGDQQYLQTDAPEIVPQLAATGQWTRIEGIYQPDGKGWEIIVNGKSLMVSSSKQDSLASTLALRAVGKVECCNLFVGPRSSDQ